MNLSEKQKGILSLIALAVVYASLGIFVRYLALSFAIFQQLYIRLLSASILVSLAIIQRRYQTKLLNNNEITQIMLIFGFIFVFVTSLGFGEGLPLANWNLSSIITV